MKLTPCNARLSGQFRLNLAQSFSIMSFQDQGSNNFSPVEGGYRWYGKHLALAQG
jgi:hypothetical protein